jgi:hypothetical protein
VTKEVNRIFEGPEQLTPEVGPLAGNDRKPEAAIAGCHCDAKSLSVFVDAETSETVGAGKDPVSTESGQTRIGSSSRYEHSRMVPCVVVPFNGEAMGDILGGQADGLGEMGWSEAAQTNEAHSANSPSRDHLWSERCREVSLHNLGINPIVDEETSLDRAWNGTGEHVIPLSLRWR